MISPNAAFSIYSCGALQSQVSWSLYRMGKKLILTEIKHTIYKIKSNIWFCFIFLLLLEYRWDELV